MGTRVSTSAAPDFDRTPEALPEAGAAEAGGKIRGRRQLPVRSNAHVVRVLIGSSSRTAAARPVLLLDDLRDAGGAGWQSAGSKVRGQRL